MGRGGGELASVCRTGGIDHDNGTEPGRARWFTPQLLVAAGIIKVAGTTVAGAGPVPGPGPIQRDGAVYLDEPAGKACVLAGAHSRTQVLSSTAPGRVTGGAQQARTAALPRRWEAAAVPGRPGSSTGLP